MSSFAPAPVRLRAPRRLRTATIAGLGVALPDEVVTNAPIAERVGVTDDWIVARTGVRERRRAAAGTSLTGLAAAAGRSALERASLDPADLDLVLVATFTQDDLLPNAAPLVAEQIGAVRAGALDIGAACTGFLGAVSLAAGLVETGRAQAVLVVGAELMSRVTDYDDRRTAALFGDGAGAALIMGSNDAGSGGANGDAGGRIGPVLLHSDAEGAECIRASHDDRLVRMRGQDTFKAAVARMSEVTLEACAAAGVGLDDIDLFVYHQANARITRSLGERLALPPERVVDCIGSYGNTSAASIPIALAEAEAEGRLEPGSRVLLAAFGAGFVWGAGVVDW